MANSMITMPAVALRGMCILPGMIAHFDISREKSIHAVERAMSDNEEIFLITQKEMETENPTTDELYTVGIQAEIKQVIKLQNDVLRVLVEGKKRAKLLSLSSEETYLLASICLLEPEDRRMSSKKSAALVAAIQETFTTYAKLNTHIGKEITRQVQDLPYLEMLMDYITNNLPVRYDEKQKVLEAINLEERYEVLMAMLLYETEVIDIKNDFQQKVKERVDKHQKEYLLREQMAVIRKELGEDNTESDADEYREQCALLSASEEVKKRINKEINRFVSISSNSSESSVVRGYIETLLELPWDKKSEDNTDLKNAKEVLDADHYGLTKVKERVLEFLAVRNLTSKGESPIICLVGPPGTGKTSIAKSVATALNKEYVRICLGGVRDEAEIRGHRRTYVGAMPGRIVSGLRQAGVSNPLMLLDEIDKVSSDYKGDTSAALLEVLDSEQNRNFRDHFVELPIDLSEVMFIATANSLQTIPKPLLDRMEIIEVGSYTENEKFHIAKEHLVKKQMEKNGIAAKQMQITDAALTGIIRYYTREAGVRSLERKIGEVCRKTARMIYENPDTKKISIKGSDLETYLGMKKYSQDKKNAQNEVGIVRGLAWTSVGGVTLEIEVNVMPGKGEIQLTGQLGDVMKESARAAISYIRSIAATYKIADDYFSTHDIHVHIPEGATPKDGPSAGITMATAILSAVTDIPVRSDVAMTGEITLRGRVLPIGGLKEKLLAAKTAGMHTVCIPKENEKDLEEIDDEIKGGMEILPVKHLSEVTKVAFAK